MTVKFVQWVPFVACKNPFLAALKDKNSLPQQQQLNEFIVDNSITDVDFNNDSKQHQMIVLIINERYCLLDQLKEELINASTRVQKYLYLAVNKFFIYSNDNLSETTTDYDNRLVDYCKNLIDDKFTLLKHTARPDDNGLLGNFIHPVTTMFFKRNE